MATTRPSHHDVPTQYPHFFLPETSYTAAWPTPRMAPCSPISPYTPVPTNPLPQARQDWQGIGYDLRIGTGKSPKRRRLEGQTEPDDTPTSAGSAKTAFDGLTSFTDFNDGGFALFGDTSQDASVLETDAVWDTLGDFHPDELAASSGRSSNPMLFKTEYDSSADFPNNDLIDPTSSSPSLLNENDILADLTLPLRVPAVTTGRPLGDKYHQNGDMPFMIVKESETGMKTHTSGAVSDCSSHSERRMVPSHRNLSNKGILKKMDESDEGFAQRPALNEEHLKELNDITAFKNSENAKLIVDYREGITFPLGEGGRELLRACLNVKGCKGRQLQGASVPALLSLAKQWGLWDVAIRIKVERATGQLCDFHEKFVRFKATQSQIRKYVKKEYMLTERGNDGKISKIVYDENRKITLGKEGREALRAQLRRLHDKHPGKMDELLSHHGFKYSELRNATVQQLSRMAFVCNLWDQVVHACRKQEEKRDGKGRELTAGEQLRALEDGGHPSIEDTNVVGMGIKHEEGHLLYNELPEDQLGDAGLSQTMLMPPPDLPARVKQEPLTDDPSHLWNGAEDMVEQIVRKHPNVYSTNEDLIFRDFLAAVGGQSQTSETYDERKAENLWPSYT